MQPLVQRRYDVKPVTGITNSGGIYGATQFLSQIADTDRELSTSGVTQAMRILLLTLLFCVGCASNRPVPGTLSFIQQQQQRELALECYLALTRGNSRSTTYYNVDGVFVDERGYCDLKARLAAQTIGFTR